MNNNLKNRLKEELEDLNVILNFVKKFNLEYYPQRNIALKGCQDIRAILDNLILDLGFLREEIERTYKEK